MNKVNTSLKLVSFSVSELWEVIGIREKMRRSREIWNREARKMKIAIKKAEEIGGWHFVLAIVEAGIASEFVKQLLTIWPELLVEGERSHMTYKQFLRLLLNFWKFMAKKGFNVTNEKALHSHVLNKHEIPFVRLGKCRLNGCEIHEDEIRGPCPNKWYFLTPGEKVTWNGSEYYFLGAEAWEGVVLIPPGYIEFPPRRARKA